MGQTARRPSSIPAKMEYWLVRSTFVGYFDGSSLTVHSTSNGWWWAEIKWWCGDYEIIGPLRSDEVRREVRCHHGDSIMSFLQRRTTTGAGQSKPGQAVLGSLAGLPGVLEYLEADHYPDGATRERSALIVLVQDGIVKVCLSDKDQGQSIWRSGSSLEDALLALEAEVTGPQPDWRSMTGGTKKGHKKK